MLEVRHLTRRYGQNLALSDASFTVPAGHLVGFVGGNGAGKTTAMRIIMGLLAPDAGEVWWQGAPVSDQVRRTFGYMPEERGLYPKQPIIDQLIYMARLKGMETEAARTEAMTLLSRFGLGERAKDRLEKLSLGNQQRVQIATAIMARPSALILDEPFSGLDPDAVDSMAGLLRDYCGHGVPVLFSSHQLDLVERLCDGLVILAKGQVVAAGSRAELQRRGRIRHRLVTDHPLDWLPGWLADPDHPVDPQRARLVRVKDGTALLEVDDPSVHHDLLSEALRHGNVLEYAELRPSVSDIYREVTR